MWNSQILDTTVGTPAELVYPRLGWIEVCFFLPCALPCERAKTDTALILDWKDTKIWLYSSRW